MLRGIWCPHLLSPFVSQYVKTEVDWRGVGTETAFKFFSDDKTVRMYQGIQSFMQFLGYEENFENEYQRFQMIPTCTTVGMVLAIFMTWLC